MNPCVGDKVRVSRTIRVSEVSLNGSVSNGAQWFSSNDWEIEVIEKAKPKVKVGDMISGSLYEALPAGAVMKGDNLFSIADGKGNLVTQEGRILDAPWTTRTLVFLP